MLGRELGRGREGGGLWEGAKRREDVEVEGRGGGGMAAAGGRCCLVKEMELACLGLLLLLSL